MLGEDHFPKNQVQKVETAWLSAFLFLSISVVSNILKWFVLMCMCLCVSVFTVITSDVIYHSIYQKTYFRKLERIYRLIVEPMDPMEN